MIERECDAWMEIARKLIDAPWVRGSGMDGLCMYVSLARITHIISATTAEIMRNRIRRYLGTKDWGWSSKVPDHEARALGAIWLACEAAAEQGHEL